MMNTAIQFFGSTLSKPYEWKNALYVDQVDDSIHIPYSPSMDFTGKSFSIMAWVNALSPNTAVNSMITNWNGIDNTASKLCYIMGLGTDLGIGLRHMNGNTVAGGYNVGNEFFAGFAPGKWDLRVWIYDKEGTITNPNSNASSNPLINIGNYSAPLLYHGVTSYMPTYSFVNKIWSINIQVGGVAGGTRQSKYIDNVAFFDRALTPSEVLRLYNKGKGNDPLKIPNCVSCYLFDESPGTAITSSAQTPESPASRIILDQSGNGNHAYATGYEAGSVDFVDHFTLT